MIRKFFLNVKVLYLCCTYVMKTFIRESCIFKIFWFSDSFVLQVSFQVILILYLNSITKVRQFIPKASTVSILV